METTMIKINLEKEKSTLVSPLAGVRKSFVESFRKEATKKFESALTTNANKLTLTGSLIKDLDDETNAKVQLAFRNYVLSVCQNLVSRTVIEETVDNWIGHIDSIISYCRKFVKDELDVRELQTKYVVAFFQSLSPAVSEYFYDTESTMQSILDKKMEELAKPKINIPNTINAFINDNPDKAKELVELALAGGKKFIENVPNMTKEELTNLFITKGTTINNIKEFFLSTGLDTIDKLLVDIFDNKTKDEIIKLIKYLIEDEYDNFVNFGNEMIARINTPIDSEAPKVPETTIDSSKDNVIEMPIQSSPEAAAAAAANVAQINNPMFEQEMLMKEQASIHDRVSFVQEMRETKSMINNNTDSNRISELEKLDAESMIANNNIESDVISEANNQEEIDETTQPESTPIEESKVEEIEVNETIQPESTPVKEIKDEIEVSKTEDISTALDEGAKNAITNIEEIKDIVDEAKEITSNKGQYILNGKNVAAEKILDRVPKNNTKSTRKKAVTK